MSARPTPGAYLSWTPTGGSPQTLIFDAVEGEEWDLGATVTEHPVEEGADVADNVRVSLAKVSLDVFVSNEPVGPSQWATPTVVSQPLSVKVAAWTPGTGVITVQGWESELAERAAATSAGGLVAGPPGAVAAALLSGALIGPHATATPVQTDAGLVPGTAPSLTAQTLQFLDPDDFVARTIALLELLRDQAQLFDVIGSKNARGNMVIETLQPKRDESTGTGARITLGLKEIRIVQTALVVAPKPSIPRGAPPTSKGPQNTTDAPAQLASTAASFAGLTSTGGPFRTPFRLPLQ